MKLYSILLSVVFLTACSSSNDNINSDADDSPISVDTSTAGDPAVTADPVAITDLLPAIDTSDPVDTSTPAEPSTPEETATPVDNSVPADTAALFDMANPPDTATPVDTPPPTETETPADTSTTTDPVALTPELEFPIDDLLVSVAGYQSEALADTVFRISDTIETIADNRVVITDNQVVVEGTATTTTNRISYSCSAGGQMIIETIIMDDRVSSFSSISDSDTYTFEQCVMSISDDNLVNGDYGLNGTFALSTFSFSGRGTQVTTERRWDLFSLVNPDSSSKAVDGSTADVVELDGDSRIARLVDIRNYEHVENDQRTLSMIDVSVNIGMGTQGSGFVNFYTLNASGEVQGLLTLDNVITISTDPEFNSRITSQEEISPSTFTGGMRMDSDSGSSIVISANQSNLSSRLISYIYTSAIGDTVTVDEQSFINLFDFAP